MFCLSLPFLDCPWIVGSQAVACSGAPRRLTARPSLLSFQLEQPPLAKQEDEGSSRGGPKSGLIAEVAPSRSPSCAQGPHFCPLPQALSGQAALPQIWGLELGPSEGVKAPQLAPCAVKAVATVMPS